ncbi:hypothetical protein [Celerinatantimonas diazotrophica]|uniref:Uncharacterized protein n=1 Tax=Celerinatantimonas diazotrophica TaxID=412034 RepID=A0A4V2PRA5_9GAMM|nr:hypothetical protein [Celerinatantimonas diazotrophica]TCK58061.1 hypothetical protein EV690_1766 [Celerinatantimonas diazotrophica]CAG9297870.1 hypothetical protein CEDIAZO_03062 [Celerinatantimonas diazotrophica]
MDEEYGLLEMKEILFLSIDEDIRAQLAQEYFNHWCQQLNLPYHASARLFLTRVPEPPLGLLNQSLHHLLTWLAMFGSFGHAHSNDPIGTLGAVSYQEMQDALYLFSLESANHPLSIGQCYPELHSKVRYFTFNDQEAESITISTELLLNQVDQWIAQLSSQPSSNHGI